MIYAEQNNLKNNNFINNGDKNYNNFKSNSIFSFSSNPFNKENSICNNNTNNYKIKIIIGKIYEGSFHIIKNDYNILFNNTIIEFFSLNKDLIILGNYDVIFVFE